MKTTIKSLLMLGLISNLGILFSMEDGKPKNEINDKIKLSYTQFRKAEIQKRGLRYCTGALGLLGIGGLIYYSWRSDAGGQEAERILNNMLSGRAISADQRSSLIYLLKQGHASTVESLKMQLQAAQSPAASALPWSTAARNYIFSTMKTSFFGLTTIGTAIVMTAIQGIGASLITKGIFNPLAERFVGIYSIDRFIATKTKLNQNIKDLISSLTALNKEGEDVEKDQTLFSVSLSLLERDIINILGFMLYICSFIKKSDELIISKAKAVFKAVKGCITDLQKLKLSTIEHLADSENGPFDIDEYKEVLVNLVDKCESFSNICEEAGTDLMEDFYASTFDQVKRSLGINMPDQVPAPSEEEMEAFQQMLGHMAKNGVGE